MIYVFDSDAFIDLFRHFYPSRFPSLWDRFDESVSNGRIVSVREVRREIGGAEDRLSEWVNNSHSLFHEPSVEELKFVAEIFKVPHFQSLIRDKQRLIGRPVADPFVIAKAKLIRGCVVTQEIKRPNGSRIPNVCEHFGVDCINMEGFMERENWTF